MDKNQINQIAENLSDAEQVPDVVFQLTEDCKSLLSEVERLESRHKADQKAAEEANAIAYRYMKECEQLEDKLAGYEKHNGNFTKHFADMMNAIAETKVIIKTEKSDLKTIPTMVLVNELASREGVFQEFVGDRGSRRISVYGPANILIVNK